jgi:hypothetical protein
LASTYTGSSSENPNAAKIFQTHLYRKKRWTITPEKWHFFVGHDFSHKTDGMKKFVLRI